MPTYEYRCENGHQFDVVQKMADAPVSECEVCGAPVQRVFHAPAVHFKGKGFYNTDYGTKKRQREQAASEKSKDGGEKKSETKSDSSSGSDSGSSSSSGSDAKPADTPKKPATTES